MEKKECKKNATESFFFFQAVKKKKKSETAHNNFSFATNEDNDLSVHRFEKLNNHNHNCYYLLFPGKCICCKLEK